MSFIGLKMLFRKRGVALAILAIALPIAILTSANSTANYINSQTQALGKLVGTSRTYIVISQDSTAIRDSQIDISLAVRLSSLGYVKHVLPQRMLTANITIGSKSHAIQIVGVEDVKGFIEARRAHVSGAVARNPEEANVGEVLSTLLHIKLGDELDLSANGKSAKVRVVGIIRTQTQTDAELIAPMGTANILAGNDQTISLIELSLKEGINAREAITQITQLLPENVKLIPSQQLKEFTIKMNAQTLAFLNAWSIAVYAVVAAASYITATRLTDESGYELAMLRALGAKKTRLFTLILAYTATTALLGSILGIALGTAGAQAASTILRWIQPTVEIAPFPEAEQALQTLLVTLASSIIGCTYPAFRSTRARYMEQPL